MNSLESLVETACRSAFEDLFQNRPRNYYYLALVTNEQALCPYISAWSHEDLKDACSKYNNPNEMAYLLKWSYADSPLYLYGEQYFHSIMIELNSRGDVLTMNEDDCNNEIKIRIDSMFNGLKNLVNSGFFEKYINPDKAIISFEINPPSGENLIFAKELNFDGEILREWMSDNYGDAIT